MGAIRTIFSYLSKYKSLLGLSILSNILLAIFTVISIPLIIPFFQILFDREPPVVAKPENTFDVIDQLNYYFSNLILNYDKKQALLYVCLFIVIVFLLKNLFRYLSVFFLTPAKNGVIADIRRKIFRKYISLPLLFFADERKGDLISRMSTDVLEIESSILSVIIALFKAPLIILGSVFFMVYISPRLTIFVFILMIFTIFIIGGISKSLKRKSHKAQSFLSNLITIVEESISGMRVVKAFRAEDFVFQNFDQRNQDYRNIINRIQWRRDLASPISEFLGIAVVTTLLYYGSTQVFNQHLTPETFFAFIFAFYQVIEPSKQFSSSYFNLQKGSAALERINKIMELSDEDATLDGKTELGRFQKEIEIKSLTFAYPETNQNVINKLDLRISKGQHIAIVGNSGSGKSTLTNLLPLLYPVDKGQIFIDGIDIRDIKLSSLRSLFAIVSQDAILFHDTVLNNIKFGQKYASRESIEEAARQANAHDFILELENGYQTMVGDRGSKLSGGQKQRITIARALLNNPDILILDEATSALDAESEKLVKEALERVRLKRTMITIAHKYSTIQEADLIIVMNDGQIVQHGTHEDLMKQKGEYIRNLELQKL